MTTLSLVGDKNYLKRDSTTGNASLVAPSTLAAWFNYARSKTITHNLGFIPEVRVYYEPFADNKIFPATGRRLSGTGTGLGGSDIICLWELDETTLTIYLESTVAKTGNIPVYWVIYKDQPL